MFYAFTFLLGAAAGAFCILFYAIEAKKRSDEIRQSAEAQSRRAMEDSSRATSTTQAAEAKLAELMARESELQDRKREFDKRIIAYDELEDENVILKRDLQNVDVNLHKLEMDGQARDSRQRELEARSTALAKRYMSETVKSVVGSLGPNNYSACKSRLLDVITRCREIGYPISEGDEAQLIADLKREFELAVRAAFEREEQARIKAQIREEERLKREIDRELKQLARERAAIQAALDQALAEAKGQYSAEVERLKERLTEAEARNQRAMSMAQQTKAGHVYVISNIGTLGGDVFKIGMTRRIEPRERVYELGSASVPFPFDVHMMIHCDNAPALENALHRNLRRHRVNRANPRKEFFRVKLDEIVRIVREHHGEVNYIADAEALEYRQSLEMPEEDAAFIEGVFDAVEPEGQDVDE